MSASGIGRVLTLIGYFGLLSLLIAWYAWLSPSANFPVAFVLLVLVSPLLLPLRGLLHARPYTHAWTSYLALLYFVHGVGEAYASPQERAYALLEVILSLTLYTGALLFARFRSRELARTSEPDSVGAAAIKSKEDREQKAR